MSTPKPYVSVYSKSFVEAKKSNRKQILESAIGSLHKAKVSLKKIKEDDVTDAIEEVIDAVSTAITDIIDATGPTNPAVANLINTAQDLENQATPIDVIEDEVFDDSFDDSDDIFGEDEFMEDAPEKGVNPFEKKDDDKADEKIPSAAEVADAPDEDEKKDDEK